VYDIYVFPMEYLEIQVKEKPSPCMEKVAI